MADLKTTPLHGLHVELGARMVPFAGWEMPVQYPAGVIAEHTHTRTAAGLFDVSHMGQVRLVAKGGPEAALAALEALVPADLLGLAEGRQRYGLFTNIAGGILDDLMIARRARDVFVVVNAARAEHDIGHMSAGLPAGVRVEPVAGRALLALQGPAAEDALAGLVPEVRPMRFMDVAEADWDGAALWLSRSGYTGEDGFEISLPADRAEAFARALLADARVAPVGLGARDSLRLEAGLCLYGADIDEDTTPVEAGLAWAIGKARRPGGARAGGYPGAEIIARELAEGPRRRRVGLLPEGRAPMRGGTPLYAAEEAEAPIGTVTSGGFGPTLGRPVAMGYVASAHSAEGTRLFGEVRGRRQAAEIARLPLVPARFKR